MQEQIDKYREYLIEHYVSAKCGYYQSILKRVVESHHSFNLGYLSSKLDVYVMVIEGFERQVNLDVSTNVDTGEVIIKVYIDGVLPNLTWIEMKMDDVILEHWMRFNKAITELANYNRGIQGALCC